MSRTLMAITAVVLVLTPLTQVQAQVYDDFGNPVGPVLHHEIDGPLGSILQQIKSPASKAAGITVMGESLYVITYPGGTQTIYEVDPLTGTTKSSLQVTTTNHYGLGFDSRRNEFVLCTPSFPDHIALMNLNGIVTTTFPAPATGPIGVAYDRTRDGYWVPDWGNNYLYLMDARNGQTLKSFDIGSQGLTRLAGCGYSDVNALIYVSGRNQNKGGFIDPTSGKVLYTVNHPGGSNVGQGAAIYFRSQAPFSGNWNNGSNQTLYSFEMRLPRVESNTQVKFGATLQIKWVSALDPNRAYKGAASFSEMGFGLGNRHFPLTLDALFIVSLNVPAIFTRFTGTLDTQGEALGAVNVPNSAQLTGLSFSIAFVTIDAGAPLSISAISGPQKVLIVK